jgi:hypothetical protein
MTPAPEQPDRATAAQRRAAAADHETQVQALARYAARARFDNLLHVRLRVDWDHEGY